MGNSKTITKILCVATLLVAVVSCKNSGKVEKGDPEMGPSEAQTNQEVASATNATFKDANKAAIFQHYIHIKTALVNSDAKEASAGGEMLGKISDIEVLNTAVAKIANTEDIEVQRAAFSDLTLHIETLLDGALSSGAVYKQYCPMAFNNTGGYWLSNEKEIRNPYYGDKMLKCGMIKETLQ